MSTLQTSLPPQTSRTTPNGPNSTFQRNGTATLMKTSDSAAQCQVQVLDPALPAVHTTQINSRMQLFFVFGSVQSIPVYILADSGSVRNLIDEVFFNRLSFQPPIKSPGEVRVIGGNGEPLELKGFRPCPSLLAMSSYGTSLASFTTCHSKCLSEPNSGCASLPPSIISPTISVNWNSAPQTVLRVSTSATIPRSAPLRNFALSTDLAADIATA